MNLQDNPNKQERFIRVKDVAQMIGMGRSTVWMLTKQGKFPQPLRLGPKVTVWRLSEIEKWIEEKIRESAKQELAAG